MKKILLLIAVSAFTLSSYSQQTLSKDDYLQKSKRKKTAGFAFLGTGAALLTAGLLSQSGDNDLNSLDQDITAAILIVTGVALVVVSAPLFASAASNKKKALALSFKNEKAMQVSGNTIAVQYYPAISFKVRL